MVQAQGIQGKLKDYEKEVERIDEMILSFLKPEKYAEMEGELILNFDRNCRALTMHLNIQNPKQMSVREFIGAMKDLKEYLKPKKKNGSLQNIGNITG